MSDRSFLRIGGLAGMALAATSWLAVVVYYTLVPAAQRAPIAAAGRAEFARSVQADSGGLFLFHLLLALTALWAFVGIVATYYRIRPAGPAWAGFATLVGAISAALWLVEGASDAESVKLLVQNAAAAGGQGVNEAARYLTDGPSRADPLGVSTFLLTAIWFAVAGVLMLRTTLPRLLAALAFVAAADLFLGFVGNVIGQPPLVVLSRVVAGAVGGPIFWLWLGFLLWRDAEKKTAT
jgi:hypothetical protein